LLDPKTRLILALDVAEPARALEIAGEVVNYIDAIKVHWPVILNDGLQLVPELSKLRPVIIDAKLSDIPNTNRAACDKMSSFGARGVICQGFAGDDSVGACIESGLDVYVLVEMTHSGSLMFMSEHSEDIASMARFVGATGIVAPGNRPERVTTYRSIVGPVLQILCPGIGAQGGRPGDAVATGADFEIVGRSIYASEDPERAAEKISKSIASRTSA
jgi:orotidine-5'-phosphate decarboxylase